MLRTLLLLLLVFFGCTAVAQFHEQPATTAFDQKINTLLQRYQYAHVGVKVIDLKNNAVLAAMNDQKLFMPASNMKLLTAVAAVIQLGKDYRYTTSILATNKRIEKGVLRGNVYFNFSGDPSLDKRDLYQLIASLRKQGISKIDGNIYIVANSFGPKFYGPGWMWDDENTCFSAPVSSIILDHNCFNAEVRPSPKLGHVANIFSHQPQTLIKFINNTTTTAHYNRDCALDLKASLANHYTLSGCMPQAQKRRYLSIAIKNPILYGKELIKLYLKDNRIAISGKVISGSLKPNLIELAAHQSKPLAVLLKKMLKESDNLYADAFFKTIGTDYFKTTGTWQNSRKAVEAILAKNAGLNFKHINIFDGAGGSRYDFISPDDFIKLLTAIYHNPDLRETVIPALPIAGEDGTLIGRLYRKLYIGRVRAKTGTMRSVSTLSGYITTNRNNVLAFSIMVNGFTSKARRYQHIEDKICQLLIDKG